jgi:16S rRNA (uracil1498-N3)-methyltransferase
VRRRFFIDKFDGERAVMRGETADHLGRVLRAETGQLYELSDGTAVWLARIENVSVSKRQSRIDFALVEPIAAHDPQIAIHLLISLIKFDRFEWCLEKATELGVSEIIPLSAARSDKQLIDAAAKRGTRWGRILLEAAQQSRRLRPPSLANVIRPAEAFAKSGARHKIMLSERADAPSIQKETPSQTNSTDFALAIGPEGGWTDEEIEAATAAGFSEASLGETILRTETAVIAAISIVRFGFQSRTES